MNIGDIITAYHKGYWKITEIYTQVYFGKEYELVKYTQVADSKCRPTSGRKTKQCHRAFCKPAVESLQQEITDLEELIELKKTYLNSLNVTN